MELNFFDKVMDFIAKIGLPGAICAGVLYMLYAVLAQIIVGQALILRQQELIFTQLVEVSRRLGH